MSEKKKRVLTVHLTSVKKKNVITYEFTGTSGDENDAAMSILAEWICSLSKPINSKSWVQSQFVSALMAAVDEGITVLIEPGAMNLDEDDPNE